jgi:predicted Zn-dependent protease
MKTPLLLLFFCLQFLSFGVSAQQTDDIPSFGEGNAVSLNQEYYLGRAWLMSFRRQAPIVNDPILQNYVETLIYRLVETSKLQERRLEIVLVESSSINAFAVPGGIVGIHNGLIEKAENEAQFTSVLTHELAHLSQRHFSRGVEGNSKSTAASMAGLLGGLVMIAAGSADAGIAAIMGGQAAAMSNRLSYSRLHEQEADRIGMQNQVAAGLDPGGAAGMFTVMQRAAGARTRPPEFLLSHPVTESRIADARNRAHTYPNRMYEDNPVFQLMRARVELSYMEDSKTAVEHFRRERKKGGRNAVAAQYGLVLALTKNGDFAEAKALLKPMREFAPTNMTYGLAEADINIEEEDYEKAISLLERGLKIAPDNNPISMYLAKAYFRAGYYEKADKLLSHQSRLHTSGANLWYALAEVQGKAGNILGLHQSRAEYFLLNGSMDEAIEQLSLAAPLAKDNVTKERIYSRIGHFERVKAALEEL